MIIWSKLYSIEVNQAKVMQRLLNEIEDKVKLLSSSLYFHFIKLDGMWFLYKSYDNFPVCSHFENPPLLQSNFL